MSEEVFDRKNADELTLLIADRLGRRQEMLDRMAEWERPARTIAWRPAVLSALAIAACLAVAFVVLKPAAGDGTGNLLDELGIEAPTFEEYRAATPQLSEITTLIENENYALAIEKVELALEHSDRELRGLEMALLDTDDEVLAYAEETEQQLNGELRWAYIYLLVRVGRTEDALAQLKRYLKLPSYVMQHKDEAKALRKKLKAAS